MNTWLCTVYTKDGKRLRVSRDAVSYDILLANISREGLILVEAHPGNSKKGNTKNNRISSKNVLLFSQNLLILMESGLSLKQAIQLCGSTRSNKELKDFLTALNEAIQKGTSFSEALEQWASSFGSLYLSLIRVGERSGDMQKVLARIVEFLQLRTSVQEKILSSLMYPVLVLGVAIIGLTMLLVFIVPVLVELASSMNQGAGNAFSSKVDGFQQGMVLSLVLLSSLIILVITLWQLSRRKEAVRLILHRIYWTLPLLSQGSRILNMLFFSFAMETLLAAGYTLDTALGEAEATVGNQWFRKALERTRHSIVKGASFSKTLEAEPSMPENLVNWIHIGEKTGSMDTVFTQLRRYYHHELDKGSQRLMSLVEPVLILLIGFVILSLIQSIITPLFGMMGSLL